MTFADPTSYLLTSKFDVFYYTESNHHHPIREANAKCFSVSNLDSDGNYRFKNVNDMIACVIGMGGMAKGSGRCGVTEIQTDQGIYHRVGGNGFSRGKHSKWSYKSWEALEAANLDLED